MTTQEFFKSAGEQFKNLSMGRKVGLFAVLALAIAAIVVSSMWATAPRYEYLFTDLTDTDAALIVQELKGNNIPYRLAKNGTAVMVPDKNVYENRLELASKGLPKGGGGKGFSLFDETSFSTSEFVQKINYQRALEEELANTIKSMEEIDSARVHIVLPKESVFIEEETPAKASVVIKPKTGTRLNSRQVEGIVYLVAKSVRGLEPENISIIETTGRVLYEGKKDDSAAGFASNSIEVRQSIERMLEQRAQDMLERVVGPNSSVVRVSADINMDMVKKVEDTYDPEVQVARSEELKNSFKAGAQSASGVAGTQSNLPTGKGEVMSIPPNAESGTSSVVRNYEIGRNQTETVKSPGEIRRLTISIVVDGTYEPDKKGKPQFKPRSAAELKNIEDAVKNAVGYNADREDLITISCMAFAQEDSGLTEPTTKDKLVDMAKQLAQPFMYLLIVLMVLLMVIRPIIKWLGASIKPHPVAAPAAAAAANVEDQLTLSKEGEIAKIEAMSKNAEVRNAVQDQRDIIENMTQNDIESATAVVRAWLQEKE